MQIVRLDRWQTSVETQAEIQMTKRRVKICNVSGGGGEGKEKFLEVLLMLGLRVVC